MIITEFVTNDGVTLPFIPIHTLSLTDSDKGVTIKMYTGHPEFSCQYVDDKYEMTMTAPTATVVIRHNQAKLMPPGWDISHGIEDV